MNKEISFKASADDILLNLPGHVYWKDKNGIFLGCNLQQAKSLGYNHPKEIIGKTDFDFSLKEDAEFIRNIDLRVINEKRELLVEEPIYNKLTRETVCYLSKKSPIIDNGGNVIGIMGVSLKTQSQPFEIEEIITKNNQYETTLSTIISLLPGNVYWKDKNGVFLGCNQQQAEAIGFISPKDVIGKTAFDTLPQNQAEEITRIDKQIMETGNSITKEEISDSVYTKGSVYLSTKVPLKNNKNEVIGILGVSLDITDRKKLEEDRRIALEKAEAGERAKTEFIANVTHDIRTPLTGIIGVSEYLQDTMEKEDERKNVGIILAGGKQLLGLLNDVLENLSGNTEEENQAVHKPFDLYAVIDDLCELERPAILSHHLELHLSMDKEIPRYLIGDKIKLHRILLNLIGNGIKFTEKGSITLALKLLEKKGNQAIVKISVTDTGIGIPPESQKQVFDRFYKVSSSYKGKFKGNGIGLHIVQKYTKLLGGEISLHSKPGEGTTFSLILTLPVGESAQNNKDEDYKTLLEEEKQLIDSFAAIELKKVEETKLHDLSQKPQILVIEDNAVALHTLKLMLSRFDVEVQEAIDAEIAFELIKNQRFDLIITDIGLPGISGDELAVLTRKYEEEEGISPQKIVALTGHAGTDEFALQCENAGINKVYKKPMMLSDLKDLVAPLLSLQEVHKNIESHEKPKAHGKLGVDLPDTEEELFEIYHHPLLDLQVGAEVLGSEEIAKEIHHDFKNQTLGDDLERIKQAHEKGDWAEVERFSHKIKGGSCYGTVRLYYALLYMERYLKAGHKNCAEKLYNQMLRVIDETTAHLEKNL